MLTDNERELLRDVLSHVRAQGEFPRADHIRRKHKPQGCRLEDLGERGFVCVESGRCQLTLKGLRACENETAQKELDTCSKLLPVLEQIRKGKSQLSAPDIAEASKCDVLAVQRALSFLSELHAVSDTYFSPATGLAEAVHFNAFSESVPQTLDPAPETADAPLPQPDESDHPPRLRSFEVSGYRSLNGMRADLDDLNIIVGPNGAGKSNLFSFLRFISFAVTHPLPPEIDPGPVGQRLFFVGGPERISFSFKISLDRRLPLEYHADIHGPMGAPKVTRELVKSVGIRSASNREPFLFLHRLGESATVANRIERTNSRTEWNFPLNDLALRRMLDPTLFTLSKLRDYIAGWRFYPGFNVGADAHTRKPSLVEPEPVLNPDGSNISAVLAWLLSDHQDAWEELDARLHVAVPGFRGLTMKTDTSNNTAIVYFREGGLKQPLTLADLSRGALLMLCWTALCVSPNLPPLLCIDAPERDLHPRALTVLADMLRQMSTRTQIVIFTQSPHFLAHFPLKSIAVIRKEEGRSVFFRPAAADAILRDVERPEGEALAQLFVTGELEGVRRIQKDGHD